MRGLLPGLVISIVTLVSASETRVLARFRSMHRVSTTAGGNVKL
jgi:hypothetical protein